MGHLLQLYVLLTFVLTQSSSSDIYHAQCRAECVAEYTARSTKFKQCVIPCEDSFDNLLATSCFRYCTGNGEIPCHFSCKFIKKLYTKGYIPGKCPNFPIAKGQNECDRYRTCGGLKKCCFNADYNRCWDITIPGEELKVFASNITKTSLQVEWELSNITNVVYIVQLRVLHSTTIYYSEHDWGEWLTEWQGTEAVALKISMIEPGTRLQFRVAVIDKTGLKGIGPPTPVIQTQFTVSVSSSPEAMWVAERTFGVDNQVNITLAWLSPAILDVPVHSYKLFWRQIPLDHSEDLVIVKERKRVPGDHLNYTITGLPMNRMYYVEIQAVCLHDQKRLKSQKLGMNVSTHRIRGVADKKITLTRYVSNFSGKHLNSTYRDAEIKEIEVIVESDEDGTTPQSPSKNHRKNGSNLMSSTTTTLHIVVPTIYVLLTLLA